MSSEWSLNFTSHESEKTWRSSAIGAPVNLGANEIKLHSDNMLAMMGSKVTTFIEFNYKLSAFVVSNPKLMMMNKMKSPSRSTLPP